MAEDQEFRELGKRVREMWEKYPEEQPRMLMEIFSIDKNDKGALAWAALTFATAAGIPQPSMMGELSAAAHMPRAGVYKLMNKAMAPALAGDQEALEMLGLHQCERASELARAVARTMRASGYRDRREGGVSDWLKALKLGS